MWRRTALLLGAVACGPSRIAPAEPTGAELFTPPPRAPEAVLYAEAPRESAHASPGDPVTRALLDACGGPDGALDELASAWASARAAGRPTPLSVKAEGRARGAPYVAPQVWIASAGPSVGADALRARLTPWLAHVRSPRRCGVGAAPSGEGRVFAVVASEAAATLAPVTTRVRVGEWLTVDAQLLVGATDAKLVVLGPSGRPRPVPTTFTRTDGGGHVRARFAPDRAGAFVAQLVADLEDGPRPVLEFDVYAGVSPEQARERPAPGESKAGAGDDADSLSRMLRAARDGESLPELARSPTLDALCSAHVARMTRTGRVAHDSGDGDPALRAESAGLRPHAVGENVARARSTAAAHRVLWASPSHRANILSPAFTHVGIAAARGPDGDVFVCELFADDPG
jgi:hypothetical protein